MICDRVKIAIPEPRAHQKTGFLMNRVLDVIFFIDLCLQFFVAYQVGNDFWS